MREICVTAPICRALSLTPLNLDTQVTPLVVLQTIMKHNLYCGFLDRIFFLSFRVFAKDTNIRTEPKFIVFFTSLLALFKFCPNCKADDPLVEVYEAGTMAQVKCTCTNEACKNKETIWNSQPYLPNTKIPAGNFLLSFAILIAGTSASKVVRVFQHMGTKCISLSTFFRHQRVSGFVVKKCKLKVK